MEELINLFRNSRLQLAASVTWTANKDGDVVLSSDHLLRLESCPRDVVRCLHLLERGADYHELQEVYDDQESLDSILEILVRARYVVPARANEFTNTSVEKQVDYFSAHGIDGNEAQRRLWQSHIVILGVGGTGTVILQHLVAAGVRSFSLIDPDRIHANNLNRQLIFSPDQVGRSKCAAARDYVIKHNSKCNVLTFEKGIETVEDLTQLALPEVTDLLVLAADQPVRRIKEATAEFATRRSIPFIEGSCGFQTAVCGPLIEPESCSRYLMQLRTDKGTVPGHKLNIKLQPANVMKASFGPTNTILAAFMARDIVHYLVQLPVASLNSLIVINFENAQTERVRFFN